MNRTLYVVLCVFEVLAIIALVLVMALPIQDYALREFIEWREPSIIGDLQGIH